MPSFPGLEEAKAGIPLHSGTLFLTGVFTLRASESGRICFVAKGSQYREYSFTLRRRASAAVSTRE